ncbi:phage holin, LLH family [Sporolactobacillus terrae]|uniref:phage holin, LLH family n=1 Tax=Sporolactobacillus terrae TaxID=269673 RepID=UPI001CC1BB26|nr:phage holin, LLH family [Sporolactobacillus terrae]UAK17543.1 phage holin family protein [Sporolactobacillus terrae]
MDISNYLDTAILAIITAVIGVAVKYGINFAADVLIKSHAVTFVKAAESIYNGSGLGAEKYQFAADALVAFAAKLHIKLDAATIKKYIEAAVTDLHALLPAAVKEVKEKVEEAEKAEVKAADTQTTVAQEQTTEQQAAQEAEKAQTEAQEQK